MRIHATLCALMMMVGNGAYLVLAEAKAPCLKDVCIGEYVIDEDEGLGHQPQRTFS